MSDVSESREPIPPPPGRAEAKAALLAEWEAAEKANPPPPPEPNEEQRMAAEDPDADAPLTERPANEPAVDAELERAAAVEDAAAAPVAPAETDPATLRGIQAIEARDKRQREQHQQREVQLRGYEQNLRAAEAKILEREKRVQERELQALQDPVGFYRSLGVDKGFRDIAEQFYVAELGPDAPPELKAKAQTYGVSQEQRRLAAEFQKMRAEIAAEREQLAAQQQVQAYRGQLSAELAKLPTKFQYLKGIAQRDPNRAVELMFAEAVEYARANPHDEAPPADYLAEQVEKKFSPFYGTTPKNKTPEQAGEKRTASPVNQPHTGRTPVRSAPKTRDELRAEVLRALQEDRTED